MKVTKGQKLMKVDSNGNRTGWHEFTADCTGKIVVNKRTWDTVLKITNGIDRGTYALKCFGG